MKAVAIAVDIKAMFHLVKVPDKDMNWLRFLWWPGGDKSQLLEEYQMCVHLFGAASSPSCVIFALKQTAVDNGQKFCIKAADTLRRNLYVDDMLNSASGVSETVKAIYIEKDVYQADGFT